MLSIYSDLFHLMFLFYRISSVQVHGFEKGRFKSYIRDDVYTVYKYIITIINKITINVLLSYFDRDQC